MGHDLRRMLRMPKPFLLIFKAPSRHRSASVMYNDQAPTQTQWRWSARPGSRALVGLGGEICR